IKDPVLANARSFSYSLAFALVLSLVTLSSSKLAPRGLALAVASGGLASALGYAVWYRALRGLSATQAAIVQLSVPVIAALASVVFLKETLSARLIACGAAVLGGVGLALSEKRPARS